MKRRDFLKVGGGASLAGAWGSTNGGQTARADDPAKVSTTSPAVLSSYTSEDHRHRLQNIARCEQGIHTVMRKHLVTSYLSGQACYNLGDRLRVRQLIKTTSEEKWVNPVVR